jgi:hypothetical protein
MKMYFFSKFEYFMYFLVTGFSGSSSVPDFLVDRFDDQSGSGNFDFRSQGIFHFC